MEQLLERHRAVVTSKQRGMAHKQRRAARAEAPSRASRTQEHQAPSTTHPGTSHRQHRRGLNLMHALHHASPPGATIACVSVCLCVFVKITRCRANISFHMQIYVRNMCVCVCIYTYIDRYALIHTYIHTYIHACMHTCMHPHTQARTHAHTQPETQDTHRCGARGAGGTNSRSLGQPSLLRR